MVSHIIDLSDSVKSVSTIKGRTVGEIVDSIGNENRTPTTQEKELIDIIEYLTGRLIHSEIERF